MVLKDHPGVLAAGQPESSEGDTSRPAARTWNLAHSQFPNWRSSEPVGGSADGVVEPRVLQASVSDALVVSVCLRMR